MEQIVKRLCGCCRSQVGGRCCEGVLEHAGVGNGEEQAEVDSKEGAQQGWRWGGGRGRGGHDDDNNATFKSGMGCEG